MSTKSWPTPGQLADALESGRYEKTAGTLVSTMLDSFCCLGVAACEAGYAADEVRGTVGGGRTYLRSMFGNGTDPSGLVLGDGPDWMSVELERELSRLNDDHGNWGPVIEKLRSLENRDV